MKKSQFTAAFAAALLMGALASAESAHDIIAKSVSLPVPTYSTSGIKLDFIEKSGKVSKSEMLDQYGKDTEGLVYTIFDFRSPADVKDTRFLQAEKQGKSDDKWIYLPSLRTTRRVATTERSKSFMGCDFSYDDMSLRDVEQDTHEMVNENVTKNIAGTNYNCWQIKSVPVKKNDSGYSSRMQYIDKETYLPVFIEYYDKTGKHLKDYSIEKIVKTPSKDGSKTYYIRWVNYMVNVQTGHATRVSLTRQELEKVQPERLFTQSWLNTGK